jgi:hypothetical protein
MGPNPIFPSNALESSLGPAGVGHWRYEIVRRLIS